MYYDQSVMSYIKVIKFKNLNSFIKQQLLKKCYIPSLNM